MPNPEDPKDKPKIPPPYAGTGETLILRDVLAIDRTRLANERTLLAWLRTGLMLLVSGVTLIKLFEGQTSEIPVTIADLANAFMPKLLATDEANISS